MLIRLYEKTPRYSDANLPIHGVVNCQ